MKATAHWNGYAPRYAAGEAASLALVLPQMAKAKPVDVRLGQLELVCS